MQVRPLHEWGPLLWGLIHTISIVDFENEEAQIKFSQSAIVSLKAVADMIICKKCSKHYQEFFHNEIEGRDRYGRMELFRIMVEFHNQVNQKLGKPVLTYEEALLRWTKTIG